LVRIIFVKTTENDADLWMKHVSGELFDTHSSKVVWDEKSLLLAGGVLESDSQNSAPTQSATGSGMAKPGKSESE
jgi:hypothetical protein